MEHRDPKKILPVVTDGTFEWAGIRAEQQHKPEREHWAHMVVHGVLHLRGFDHQTETQAGEMETLEKLILQGLGIQDPYQPRAITQ